MDLEFLRGLIGAVDESGIDSLEISRGGTRIRISKTPPPAPVSAGAPMSAAPAHMHMPPVHEVGIQRPAGGGAPAQEAAAPAAAPPVSNLVEIKSPMVGTFYRAPAPEAPPYVENGSKVGKGQTLCILEAMKLMNELESDVAGTVREVCVENGEPVEYGQVLFRIEPAA
ncbi:acetyl-CoA carboxylase biotin carboxyl carrier protein [Longimicrobium sp.]|uniref:acetyl-CoA carboxylase biotin carboxyl carrier protein n=1 Tax=Longimicrobium sp. TaxID=2029185 RepID=UPI0032C22674